MRRTLPLGNTPPERVAPVAPGPWSRLRLALGGGLWILAALALSSRSGSDPAFTTSGTGGTPRRLVTVS